MQRISGNELRRVDVGALSGLRGYEVRLDIVDTQVSLIPETLFLTLDRISMLSLNLNNNMLKTLEPFSHTFVYICDML